MHGSALTFECDPCFEAVAGIEEPRKHDKPEHMMAHLDAARDWNGVVRSLRGSWIRSLVLSGEHHQCSRELMITMLKEPCRLDRPHRLLVAARGVERVGELVTVEEETFVAMRPEGSSTPSHFLSVSTRRQNRIRRLQGELCSWERPLGKGESPRNRTPTSSFFSLQGGLGVPHRHFFLSALSTRVFAGGLGGRIRPSPPLDRTPSP